jgi:hypothetical protein
MATTKSLNKRGPTSHFVISFQQYKDFKRNMKQEYRVVAKIQVLKNDFPRE